MYASYRDRGPEVGGYRLTVMVDPASVSEGGSVRVFHVCESTAPASPLYVMGPKEILGEYVDGALVTGPAPDRESPLAPATYDGRVLPGPGLDTNYDLTEYRLAPGRHSVQWRLGPHISNEAWVTVPA